jgi:hypothetical protein
MVQSPDILVSCDPSLESRQLIGPLDLVADLLAEPIADDIMLTVGDDGVVWMCPRLFEQFEQWLDRE